MNQQILWAMAGQAALIVVGVALVLIFNHARFAALDKRIDDLRSEMNARFNAVDKWFDDLLRYLDLRFETIEGRIERLEHSVTRP